MTPQSTFLIIATIRMGQLDELRKLLATMNTGNGQVNPDNELVPFSSFDGLHVARFVILEAKTEDDLKAYGLSYSEWQPRLAFIGDCDGDTDTFLIQLEKLAGTGLSKIFSYCEGFQSETTSLLEWMRANNIRPDANYINWIGRTVRQVHEEEALHNCLSQYLQSTVDAIGRDNTRELRQKLLSHVEMEKHAGRLSLTPAKPTPITWHIINTLHLLGIPLLTLLFTPFFLLVSPLYFWQLRRLERTDPELFLRPDRQHIRELSVQEDHDSSNQFNVFGHVKPGLLRLLTLKFSLLLLNYSARHIYKRGFLTRVKTIHFARWVLMDNNRRIYFISNYDGSEESYMDDFINKASWGLNLAFSNAIGYPPTRWLIKGGAEEEQKYKYTLRRHQLPSEVWYKAYPDLTAHELSRNSSIRQGVEKRQSSDSEIRRWLSLI